MGMMLCNLMRCGYRLWWFNNEAVYLELEYCIKRPFVVR